MIKYAVFVGLVWVAIGVGFSYGDDSHAKSDSLVYLPEEQRQLVVKIVEANRTNQERIRTFECLMERSSNEIVYSERYAKGQERIYYSTVNKQRGDGVILIEVGRMQWAMRPGSPKIIIQESFTTANHTRTQAGSPWNKMDGNIGFELLNYSNEFTVIRYARESAGDDSRFIVVEIDGRMATDPQGKYTYKQICQFDTSYGCLPTRIETNNLSDSGEPSPQYVKDVTKILSYKLDGKPVYIPIEYHGVYYRNQERYREDTYRVLEDSIKINQKLPDELFSITIDPCDRFIDKDRGLDWTAAAEGVVGHQAPDFTLGRLEDGDVTLSKVKDTVIVLVFWATWCGPCQMQMPIIDSLYRWAKENDKPVAFYGITNEPKDTVKKHLEKNNYHIPILLDSKERPVYKAYKGHGILYVVIISNGIVHSAFIGANGERPVLEQHFKDVIMAALEAAQGNSLDNPNR